VSTGSDEASTREVARVARALFDRGSVRESIAMLRGAVARDSSEEECVRILREIAERGKIEGPGSTVEIDLALVDRWIRQGMLVEALALLGGTPMGSLETGREWANLLGELLAPVPVDAEETLVEMHHQLMSGGAPVALTLLDERTRREPKLPAWAVRRLELLRWMLLDNASVAEADPELLSEAPSLLAAALRPHVRGRSLKAALEAARACARDDPDNRDVARTVDALTAMIDEIGRYSGEGGSHSSTMPMYGLPAAAMQLRMGNLDQARLLYRKLADKEDDDHARLMVAEVEAVLRALEGVAVAEEELGGESTQVFSEDATRQSSPDNRSIPPEKSGPVVVTTVDRAIDGALTDQVPRPEDVARTLESQGKLDQAEAIYRGLAESFPNELEWIERAEAARAQRLTMERQKGVLVRQIKPVK
jgi:tetratricopeptide (TPR) repeat protein